MIKFVIGLIALIFVALAVYVYTDKKGQEVTKSIVTHKVLKKEVTKDKVLKPVKVTKKVVSTKPMANKKTERLVKSTSPEVQMTNSENEIGEGLTLESIENADVSDEEKERIIDDMAYYQGLHTEPSESLSDKEIQKMIDEDLKNGFIQSIN
jgi:hypothetical protein